MDSAPKIFKKFEDIPLGVKEVDAYSSALRELFFIDNPSLKKGMPETPDKLKAFLEQIKIDPVWVYYQERGVAVKTVPEDIYFKLRTSRNKDIISEQEQAKFRGVKIGIAGLSVGSAVINALVTSGGPKYIKIADFDEVEITNLNRIRAGLFDIGRNKSHIAAEHIYALDPYAQVRLWDKGITKETLESFINDDFPLDIFIDEMDSLDLKVLARFVCQKKGIPVLMATDNGDSIVLDVERFDQEPQRKIFHNLLGDFSASDMEGLDYKQWLQLATKIVGPEYLTERMQDSVLDIGKNIPAVPQLGPTASMAGAAISYVVRRIANNLDMPSGRYIVGLEEKLIPEYNSPQALSARKDKTQSFLDHFRSKK